MGATPSQWVRPFAMGAAPSRWAADTCPLQDVDLEKVIRRRVGALKRRGADRFLPDRGPHKQREVRKTGGILAEAGNIASARDARFRPGPRRRRRRPGGPDTTVKRWPSHDRREAVPLRTAYDCLTAIMTRDHRETAGLRITHDRLTAIMASGGARPTRIRAATGPTFAGTWGEPLPSRRLFRSEAGVIPALSRNCDVPSAARGTSQVACGPVANQRSRGGVPRRRVAPRHRGRLLSATPDPSTDRRTT